MCRDACFLLIALTGLCRFSDVHTSRSVFLNKPKVIHSPGYPGTYPMVSKSTWTWSRNEGFWGVQFKYIDINCDTDRITIQDGSSQVYPPICEQHTKIYTRDAYLRIQFVSNTSQPRSGFTIAVLYGYTTDDLDKQFLSFVTQPSTGKHHSDQSIQLIPILLAVIVTVALVMILLFIGVWIVSRRRQRQHLQAISLSVNVHGIDIRRGSGIKHVRKTSSQSDSEDISPSNQGIRRVPSQRSWAVRAHTEVRDGYLSPSHPPVAETRAGGSGTGNTVNYRVAPNMYTPLDSLGTKNQAKCQFLTGRADTRAFTTPKTLPVGTRAGISGRNDDPYLRIVEQVSDGYEVSAGVVS